jgi:hypothetical protein
MIELLPHPSSSTDIVAVHVIHSGTGVATNVVQEITGESTSIIFDAVYTQKLLLFVSGCDIYHMITCQLYVTHVVN